MGDVTISGAISGIDTAAMINQLVSLQTNQQTLLRNQQSAVQKRADAYSSIVTSLNALSKQAGELAKTSAWVGSTATSSSASVTAQATGTTAASLTFDVTATAAAHTLISSDSVLSTSAQVASGGSLALTRLDGSSETIDVGGGTLSEVVTAINNSGSGLRATAVQTAPGAYRLQISSNETGAGSEFTLDGLDGFTGMSLLTQGTDASITIGTNPETAYTATSSTNTFDELIPELSFTVSKVESGVTVSAAIDGSTVADQVEAMVKTANALLSDISTKSSWDITTKTGGPLSGDSTARTLTQNILGIAGTSGAPGVELSRDGRLVFNRENFLDAFVKDPSAVAQAFGAKATFTADVAATSTSVELIGSTSASRSGTYTLNITSSSARDQWTMNPPGGIISGQTVVLMRGSSLVSYTAGATDTMSDVIDAINLRSASAGFGVTASLDGTTVVFAADRAGTSGGFTATLDDAEGTHTVTGRDIAGWIDGQEARGVGDVLSLVTGEGTAVGLSLKVTTTDADLAATGGDVGSISFSAGLAQRLIALAEDATRSTTGLVTSAGEGAKSQINRIQEQIDAWDKRLDTYRETLTRQFTAMETALARMQSTLTMVNGLSTNMLGTNNS
ncbi:MAG: flagellar filament capping protein FliD [Actinomycetota bacterium]|nr:flagellar filament capping protein FliD [Actinomycetota bacterium]